VEKLLKGSDKEAYLSQSFTQQKQSVPLHCTIRILLPGTNSHKS